METYSFLREFADSWMLLALTLFYVTACLWAISPRRREANADAAQIPFRNETPVVTEDEINEPAEPEIAHHCTRRCTDCSRLTDIPGFAREDV
ncbi:MAG: cbb3-type cytochrome c oxidase subunit 3 [Pseudomonadota bacterium]